MERKDKAILKFSILKENVLQVNKHVFNLKYSIGLTIPTNPTGRRDIQFSKSEEVIGKTELPGMKQYNWLTDFL